MKKSIKYIEYIMNRKCFPDFFRALGQHTDLKEWSECVGMMNRIKAACDGFTPDVLFDVGCGKRPTLGTMIALNVKSVRKVICIDPNLDVDLCDGIDKIELHPIKLREFVEAVDWSDPKVQLNSALIALNHAHVKAEDVLALASNFKRWKYITCPCCVDNRLHDGFYYRDSHVWSPKNEFFTFEWGF